MSTSYLIKIPVPMRRVMLVETLQGLMRNCRRARERRQLQHALAGLQITFFYGDLGCVTTDVIEQAKREFKEWFLETNGDAANVGSFTSSNKIRFTVRLARDSWTMSCTS